MNVFQTSHKIVDTLTPKYGAGEARAMMRIIFENLKGWTPVDIAVKSNEEMTPYMTDKIDGVLQRILADEPVQYIFGNTEFYGLKLKVTPDTLIPRPETAELVDAVVRENQRKDLKVADLCTGSGCIAIALARNLPFAEVTATDISEAALAVADENNRTFHTGIEFLKANILEGEPSDRSFDIIVSNPPYIAEKEKAAIAPNVLDHEPALALFVPDDNPLEFYKAIISYARKALNPGGKLYFEINPLFVDDLKKVAAKAGFTDVDIWRDSFGKERFARLVRNSES